MAIEEGGAGVTTEVPAADSGSTAGAGATGSSTQATSQPAVKWEDDPRAKGMLADLQRERRARQDFERKIQEHETRLTERDRQIAALTNSRPPTREEETDQAVRDRFKQLFPQLADLTQEDVDAIREAKQMGSQYQQSEEARWTNHHSTMIADVHAGIAKELGDLTPRQINRINSAYVRECQPNPDGTASEFMQRVERGDKTVTAQFVKEYLEDFVAPVQRKQNAENVSRFRPVPNAKDRSMPLPGEKKIDPTDNDAVMKMLVESRKGRFGRQ